MAIREVGTDPAGARLADTRSRDADTGGTARGAAPGGMDFDPPTCTGVTKAQRPCGAARARGTLFCAGHLRQKGDL